MTDQTFGGIEFTDRYGGNHPSTLTGCHECEAMGCYPVYRGPGDDHEIPARWSDDDWEFVTCEHCRGTRRCSRLETAKRVPRWLLWGLPFMFVAAPRFYGTDESYWHGVVMGFKCHYLADLGLWRPCPTPTCWDSRKLSGEETG